VHAGEPQAKSADDPQAAQEEQGDDWKSALDRDLGRLGEREILDEEMKEIRSRWSRR
jgi:hypothetical protein